MVNGATMNNLTFGSLTYEPPLVSVGEVKVDRAPFSPEHGHVSGAVIHIVTRSGTDQFHGETFTFARDDALDARNFFEFTTAEPHPFTRRQFGGALGGPIRRGRMFFFAAYEGVRQRQGVDMNSLVLSNEQRAGAIDPVIRNLIPLIPRANFFDADGTPRFVGSAPAIADMDRWTIDLRHTVGNSDRVAGYFGTQKGRAVEPGSQGNSIPGFGHVQTPFKSLLTVYETHVFGSALLNEARFGRTRLNGGTFPAAPLNPTEFGIRNGVTQPIGLPQFIVAGGLNFGGPGPLPQGRYDTLYVFSDTFTRVRGRHTAAFGGEYRHFINENFAEGTGVFNFPSVAAFLAGTANSFGITLGRRTSVIDQRAVSVFFYDRVRVAGTVSLELGMRYEWHVTPTERDDRFVVFDPRGESLVRVGVDVDEIYHQNNRNIEPRVGIAWDVSGRGRTVVRAAYGRTVDQPSTTAVRDTAGNPPFGTPLAVAGSIPLVRAIDVTRPTGLAPATVDQAFRNAVLDSWNLNVQRQISPTTAVTIGYLGSRGADLRISRNINQPVNGVRPFATVAESSPLLPGTPLGNIVQVESSGFSSYHGAWLSLSKRLSRGLQFDTSYTWSKSLDTNSLNSSGFAIQDSHDIANQYRLVGLRCTPPVRAERDICASVHRACADARMAGGRHRAVAKRQPGEHRHEQQHPQWAPEHRATRCGGTGSYHRRRRSLVRSVGIYRCRSVREPWQKCRHRAGVSRHGSVDHPDRDAQGGYRPAVAGGRLQSVQHLQLRAAGQRRGHADVRQDLEDAPADRRRRFVASDPVRRQTVVLTWCPRSFRAW